MDPCEILLQGHLRRHQGQGLWVVDENPAAAGPQPGVQALTNRYDVRQQLAGAGWSVTFSDFDFTPWLGTGMDRIYYRVSKEKPVVHRVINQARACLRPGGELWLVGAKNEGTRTYFDKARGLFGQGVLHKEGKGLFSAQLTRGEEGGPDREPLDDRDYDRLREIGTEDEVFLSKPGLFGWDKIDSGSALLADALPTLYPRLATASPRVLDLGCGYGFLSARVWEQGAGEIIATDNNAAAVMACRANFARRGIAGEVVADNCAGTLQGPFDLLVCNPPFHQGFGVEGELTDRFLAAAARLLARDGQALFVVNRFIPLERKAAAGFREIETLRDDGRFKVIRLAGVRGRR